MTDAAARRRKRRRRQAKARCAAQRGRREEGAPAQRQSPVRSGGRACREQALRAKRRRRHSARTPKRRSGRRSPLQPVPPPPPHAAAPPDFRLTQPRSPSTPAPFGVARGRAAALARGLRARRRVTPRRWRRWACTGRSPRSRGPAGAADAHRRAARRTATATRSRPRTPGATTTSGGSTGWCASNQPLVERMTLVWHDWFATSNDGVGQQSLMLAAERAVPPERVRLVRPARARRDAGPGDDRLAQPGPELALEPERELRARADGAVHARRGPRRLHRAGRARARPRADRVRLRLERRARDAQLPLRRRAATTTASKTVFGQTGAWTWEQGVAMCVRHPMHPSFFVEQAVELLHPDAAVGRRTGRRSSRSTSSSGYQVRPVLEAILLHPDLHTGPRMVKPPVVFLAGPAAACSSGPSTASTGSGTREGAGQRLFYPPDVSGWDDSRWLDTSTVRGRFELVSRALSDRVLDGDAVDDYDETETPEAARRRGARLGGRPEPDPGDGRRCSRPSPRARSPAPAAGSSAPTAACARTRSAT